MSEHPIWAGISGIPTMHAVQSAIQVALIVGLNASFQVDAQESYWKRAAGGEFGPIDFTLGEQLLVDSGLIERHDGLLDPTFKLNSLLDGDEDDAFMFVVSHLPTAEFDIDSVEKELQNTSLDQDQRSRITETIIRKFQDERTKLIGQIGEEVVVKACRDELRSMGRPDLARKVRQVSLENDAAGYDVMAPRVAGMDRLLEVKATTSKSDPVSFFISRNESRVGIQNRNWAVVICGEIDIETRSGVLLGWLASADISREYPQDSSERCSWESSKIAIPMVELKPNLPSAIQ